MSQRTLSVRKMAYTVKPNMNRTEKTSNQSMHLTGTLARGPKLSSSVTIWSDAASKPARKVVTFTDRLRFVEVVVVEVLMVLKLKCFHTLTCLINNE